VILPAWNAAGTLAAALDSIRRQTFTDWELVVVDDGSTDATPEVLAAAARREPRLRWVRQPHGGIVRTLHAALALARGAWFARMDADDASTPDRLAAQVQMLTTSPDVGLASCQVRFGGDSTRNAGLARHVAWLNTLVTPEDIARNRFIESPVAHPSVLFRRELLERHGSYREGPFPEDYELWLRWLEQGVRFAKVPRELLAWNDPPGRLSHRDPRYSPDAVHTAKAPYLVRAIQERGHGREVWVWGAGRVTRRRVDRLVAAGLGVRGFIDVDSKKWGRHRDGRQVVGPAGLPSPRTAFVVVQVGRLGAREFIRPQLERAGFVEAEDYWVAA
jgi:glycosyltransferase involved in cell wall biosynthesis